MLCWSKGCLLKYKLDWSKHCFDITRSWIDNCPTPRFSLAQMSAPTQPSSKRRRPKRRRSKVLRRILTLDHWDFINNFANRQLNHDAKHLRINNYIWYQFLHPLLCILSRSFWNENFIKMRVLAVSYCLSREIFNFRYQLLSSPMAQFKRPVTFRVVVCRKHKIFWHRRTTHAIALAA